MSFIILFHPFQSYTLISVVHSCPTVQIRFVVFICRRVCRFIICICIIFIEIRVLRISEILSFRLCRSRRICCFDLLTLLDRRNSKIRECFFHDRFCKFQDKKTVVLCRNVRLINHNIHRYFRILLWCISDIGQKIFSLFSRNLLCCSGLCSNIVSFYCRLFSGYRTPWLLSYRISASWKFPLKSVFRKRTGSFVSITFPF